MAEDVILVAGTTVDMQLPDDTWQRVPSLTSIGAIGEQAEAKEKTNLADRIKRYGAGLRDAEDKNIQGQYIPYQETGEEYYDEYVLQQAFITRCRNQEEFNLRINWPDTEVNGFLFKSLGFQFNESTQEDWKMFTVNGKQNSRVIFDVSVTAASETITDAETTQLTVTSVPNDINSSELMNETLFSSSDEAVATVDEAGLVTGVAVGDVVITAEIRGVAATVEITVTA